MTQALVVGGRIHLEQHLRRCPPSEALHILERNTAIAKARRERAPELVHTARATVCSAVRNARRRRRKQPTPERRHAVELAKAICATCVVRCECLAYALENDIAHGTWGGTTERERRTMLAF